MSIQEIVWHDPRVEHPENLYIFNMLNARFNIRKFTSYSEAADHIGTSNFLVYVITSGTLGKEFIELIHNNENVQEIVIFCNSVTYHRSWSTAYNKVNIVTNDYRDILNHYLQS